MTSLSTLPSTARAGPPRAAAARGARARPAGGGRARARSSTAISSMPGWPDCCATRNATTTGTWRPAYRLVPGAAADDLTAARGLVALSTWPLDRRIVTPAPARRRLAAVVRVAEFVADAARVPARPPTGCCAAGRDRARRAGGVDLCTTRGALADAARAALPELAAPRRRGRRPPRRWAAGSTSGSGCSASAACRSSGGGA